MDLLAFGKTGWGDELFVAALMTIAVSITAMLIGFILPEGAEMFVYEPTNVVFVADGYGNRRVIVFDADTGEFKRMWAAFGKEVSDNPPEQNPAQPDDGQGPPWFGTVHGIEVSNDGMVYVADRNNSRIQIFDLEGNYLKQVFINQY